jgi:hypothetical protein
MNSFRHAPMKPVCSNLMTGLIKRRLLDSRSPKSCDLVQCLRAGLCNLAQNSRNRGATLGGKVGASVEHSPSVCTFLVIVLWACRCFFLHDRQRSRFGECRQTPIHQERIGFATGGEQFSLEAMANDCFR